MKVDQHLSLREYDTYILRLCIGMLEVPAAAPPPQKKREMADG
jgi:hypothetical protein